MDIVELEQAVCEGNFEKFVELLQKVPVREFPELQIVPKLGKVSDSEEDASIFVALRELNYSPRTSLKACKAYKDLTSALRSLQ